MKLVNNIIQIFISLFIFLYLFLLEDIFYYNIVVYILVPIFFGISFTLEYILKTKGENPKKLKYLNKYSLAVLLISAIFCIIGFINFGANIWVKIAFGIPMFFNMYIVFSIQKNTPEINIPNEKILSES